MAKKPPATDNSVQLLYIPAAADGSRPPTFTALVRYGFTFRVAGVHIFHHPVDTDGKCDGKLMHRQPKTDDGSSQAWTYILKAGEVPKGEWTAVASFVPKHAVVKKGCLTVK